MTATDLYNDLVQHGFSLSVQGVDIVLTPSSKLTQNQRAEITAHKNELLTLLASNDYLSKVSTSDENLAHPPTVDGLLNSYTDFITCQQCEYLSFTGKCTKLKKRVMVEAIRECELFKPIEAERAAITDKPFTDTENEAFLTKLEKEFFIHLAACQLCYVEQARYCDKGKQTGIIYDDLLLDVCDGQARREDYQLRLDRACISGRSVFEDYHRPDAPPPTKTHRYGMTDEDNDYLAHITRCPNCRPKGRLYCKEAKRLQDLIPFDE